MVRAARESQRETSAFLLHYAEGGSAIVVVIRWDENAGVRRDAIRSQVIDALEAQGDKGDRQ
jgi:hypothetical protein